VGKQDVMVLTGNSYTLKKKITEQMVDEYAGLSGDFNPVHMDEEFCIRHGLNGRIVHGMLVLSFLSQLIGMHLPGEGTVWLSQAIDFMLPARIGDVLSIKGTVVKEEKNISLNINILEMKVTVKNQSEKTIMRGKIKVCVK
jgi:acyl dehydratase